MKLIHKRSSHKEFFSVPFKLVVYLFKHLRIHLLIHYTTTLNASASW